MNLQPALAGASAHDPFAITDRPLDLVHLARMTFGDRSLEREVLQLFVRQSEQLLERMQGAAATAVSALAHTLKGSARGIGAWRVAAEAEAVELAAGRATEELRTSVATLRAAVEETRAIIVDLLRAH
ncbi:MAG: Hpt domain-containing protein [Variibacter sp.]|nr:Hpt domain-containing protein [Variibacter sp.]